MIVLDPNLQGILVSPVRHSCKTCQVDLLSIMRFENSTRPDDFVDPCISLSNVYNVYGLTHRHVIGAPLPSF